MNLLMTLVVAAGSLAPTSFHARPEPGIIIRGVAVVDVERGTLVGNRDIVVRNGLIDAIVPAGTAVQADGVSVIDGANLFAMPGLFDAHVHLIASPETYPTLLVAHGVTAARDLGAPTTQAIELRASFADGSALGPDLFVTGAIIDGDPPVWPFSEPVDTPEEGRAAVRRVKEAGVDMVKVYSRLHKDVYEAVVDEAHKLGLKATGHIPESVTLAEALVTGQDCNEHLMRIDLAIAALAGHEEERGRELTRMMSGWEHFNEVSREKLDSLARTIAKAGMVQCPTIIVTASIGRADKEETLDDPLMDFVPLQVSEFWASPAYRQWAPHARKVVPAMQKAIAAFHDAGVTIMVGTDLANPFVFAGQAVHQEMALWQEAGIPASAVLRAATIVPATFCGAGARLGTIATGKTASIILTRKNPLDDVHNAGEIEHVILRGRHFDRAALDKLKGDVRTSVAASRPADIPVAKVELPGVEVARGTYTFKFGQFPAGEEAFVIHKSDKGYHLHVDSRPQGGGQVPSSTTVHADASGRITSTVWKQHSAAALEATYTLTKDHLKVTATSSKKEQEPQEMPLGPNDFFSLSTYAGDFLAMRRLALKPGETRELTSLTFGYPDWRVQKTPYKITRHEDTAIERAGEKIPCSRYTSELKTSIGIFKTESWHDPEHLPYRVVVTMPFGVLSAERQ